MNTKKKTTENADQAAPKRAPYRRPKLRAYGSIQSITLATAVKSVQMDGAGGGGKTAILTVFHYRAHGLAVAANRPISELLEDPRATNPDVTILFDEQPGSDCVGGPYETTWFTSSLTTSTGHPALIATKRLDGRSFRLAYADGPAFLLDASGSTIWVTWPDALTMAATLSYLLGPVFGIAMRLRGMACLHASAVELGGEAHVFAGPEGAGKSTLAAAFARAGDRVLSDDIVTVSRHASRFVTAPGYPRVRLWPDAMAALSADDPNSRASAEHAPAGRHHLDLRTGDRFARESLPIAAIYFLEYDDDATEPRVDMLAPADALPMLATSTFAHRALDREERIAEFHMVTDLVTSVPMRRLVRPPGLNRIAAVRSAVIDTLCVCGLTATPRT